MQANWLELLSEAQLIKYGTIVRAAVERRISFAIGGSLAMAVFGGFTRPSKDLDIYVRPEDKDAMVKLTGDLGLVDYYDKRPYDRTWIYRSAFDEEIVDVIWTMANHRTEVDDHWISCGPTVDFDGQTLRLIPIEEMIWSKLYVLQRDRCDWPDVINLIDQVRGRVDWLRLRKRLGDDFALLGAVLGVYSWLRPKEAGELPTWLWAESIAQFHHGDSEITRHRASLIDTRPWLLATANGALRTC